MTRKQAKERLKFIEAWANSDRGLQYRIKGFTCWIDTANLSEACDLFHDRDDEYEFRFKPTPTLRPWKPEEVPLDCELRLKSTNDWRRKILLTNQDGIFMYHPDTGICLYTFQEICNEYEYSLDHGKTWLPCGVKE